MTSVSPTPSPPNRKWPDTDLSPDALAGGRAMSGQAGSRGLTRASAEVSSPGPRADDTAHLDEPTIIDPDVIDLRTSRLAELVAGLTGCEPAGALHAVRTSADAEASDALEVVARAMVDVDQPPPEGFRVAGFLRLDLPLAPHRSLRRWDRGAAPHDPPPDENTP